MKGYNRIKGYMSVSLITLTLAAIGMVAFMITWVFNYRETQKMRIWDDVNRAVNDLAVQLASAQNVSTPLLRPHSSQGLQMPDNFYNIPAPYLVSEQFTYKEVAEKMHNALSKYEAKNIKVEFAVYYGTAIREMNTPDFVAAFLDTSNKRFTTPITLGNDYMNTSEYLEVIIPHFNQQVNDSMRFNIIIVCAFLVFVLMAFFVTIRTLFEQRKLNKVKTDFINNMTHELKTPLATISLAVDALHNPKVQSDPQKANYFSNIIRDESKRMTKQVETILQAGLMEKQELNIQPQPIHANECIQTVADKFALQIQDKQGEIHLHLKASDDTLLADNTHFPNLINNLIDNAIKYSREGIPPVVNITTQNSGKYFVLTVEDNGIGMNSDTQKRIFEKFFRAHTGNVHNVKGFGLGMSYVKSVVSILKGKIKVSSELGKGSIFTVELPIYEE